MAVKYLIVNADDYGYYSCVSKGILKGVEHGSIKATGIMANSPDFRKKIKYLRPFDKLDKGVHLNISYGKPLTKALAEYLQPWNRVFPDKVSIVRAILTNKIPIQVIEQEWRLQIERCLNHYIDIKFLNSHEHLHMLPPLYKVFCQLLSEYPLLYGRNTTSEWQFPLSSGSLLRNSALTFINLFNTSGSLVQSPKILGMNESGQLTLSYLEKTFSHLQTGQVYELMCHPGFLDKNEITDLNLLSYHHWQNELNLLVSEEFYNLCTSAEVELINYSQLIELKNNKTIE